MYLDEQIALSLSGGFAKRPLTAILPPPPKMLLWYIIRGWGKLNKIELNSGASLPTINQWLPSFIRLINSGSRWASTLQHYATFGAELDKEPQAIIDCIERAFDQENISEMLLTEICEKAGKN